jgi:flagellar biogenesis protein FliO
VVVAAGVGLSCAASAQQPVTGQAASAPSRPIPYKQDTDLADQLARVGLGLVLALGVGVAGLYGYRRYFARYLTPAGRRMRVVESLRLTPKTALFLVEVDGRTLLISQAGETLVALSRDVPGDVA